MLASDLKLLNLVFREHLHYNRYITMTTYANCTISKARVNNLYMKNAFELWLSWIHTTEALDLDWVPGRIFSISWTGWPHGREQCEAGHRDPVSHRWQKNKNWTCVHLECGCCLQFTEFKEEIICIFTDNEYVLLKRQKECYADTYTFSSSKYALKKLE